MSSHMTLFCCYAQKERGLAQRLEQQLAPLLRRGVVGAWNELAIDVVGGWDDVHRHHYTTADIILWLVSPDFLASDYLQSAEMVNALEWQRRNEVRLVPILAEPAPWNDGRFSQLDLLPKNGLALTDSAWPDQEEACYAVVEALHTLIKELDTSPLQAKVQPAAPPPLGAPSRVSVLTGTLPLWRRWSLVQVILLCLLVGTLVLAPLLWYRVTDPLSHTVHAVKPKALVNSAHMVTPTATATGQVLPTPTATLQPTATPQPTATSIPQNGDTTPAGSQPNSVQPSPTVQPTATPTPTPLPSYAMSYYVCGDQAQLTNTTAWNTVAPDTVVNASGYSGPIHSYTGASGNPKNSPGNCSGFFQWAWNQNAVQAQWNWSNAFLPNGACSVSVHIPSWYAGAPDAYYVLNITANGGSSARYAFDKQNQNQPVTTWLDLHLNGKVPSLSLPKSTNNTYTFSVTLTSGQTPQWYLGADAIRFNCTTSAAQ